MSRFRARTDDNQPEIVKALRNHGATVAITAQAGSGFPDLVVGYKGVNYMMEIKDPSKPKSDQKLTPAQVIFHAAWTGQMAVIKTIEEAIDLIMEKEL